MMLNLLRSIFGIPVSHHAPTTGQRTQGKPRPAAGGDWTALAKPDTQGTVTVYDPKGVPLRLNRGDELAHGGEGIIYRFARNNGILIKVCKKETLEDASKLSLFRNRLNAMMKLEDCRNADFLAWPLMPVMDKRGGAVGFVMRKCTGRTLRALLAPVQVKRFFPGWNRIQVAQVALNYLDAVRMLARHKVLVNDFNPGNFLVDGTGAVRLIDCDSFQIPVEGGEPFMTRTFTPEFTAPELLLHPELFNQPRTPEGYHTGLENGHASWADACFQMIISANVLIDVAKVIGREDETLSLQKERDRLTKFVNEKLWNEEDAFYYDLWIDEDGKEVFDGSEDLDF